jgi:hypothetical protein
MASLLNFDDVGLYSGRLIHCTWIGWDPSQLATGPNQHSSDTFFLKGILATPSGWYTFFNSLAGEREIPLCLRTHREHFSPCGKPIEFRLRRDLGQRPQDVTNFFKKGILMTPSRQYTFSNSFAAVEKEISLCVFH